MTESLATQQLVTDDKVVQMVRRYLAKRGLGGVHITAATRLEDVGLDSLSMAEMLIHSRDELVSDGILAPGVRPFSLPNIQQVSDLTGLLRELAERSGAQRALRS